MGFRKNLGQCFENSPVLKVDFVVDLGCQWVNNKVGRKNGSVRRIDAFQFLILVALFVPHCTQVPICLRIERAANPEMWSYTLEKRTWTLWYQNSFGRNRLWPFELLNFLQPMTMDFRYAFRACEYILRIVSTETHVLAVGSYYPD